MMLKPLPVWSFSLGYAYSMDDLKRNITFMNDPAIPVLYRQNLTPLLADTQSVTASSRLNMTKQLRWNVNFMYNVSQSRFDPSLAAALASAPSDAAAISVGYPDASTYAQAFFASAADGSDFSAVNVTQWAVSTDFQYHLKNGFKTGIQLLYSSYRDVTNPEFTGKLGAIDFYVGKEF